MMTDKEYVNQLRGIIRQLDHLYPMAIDFDRSRCRLLDEIHDLNITWNNNRHFHHWHYIVKLILLFIVLFLVVLKIAC